MAKSYQWRGNLEACGLYPLEVVLMFFFVEIEICIESINWGNNSS